MMPTEQIKEFAKKVREEIEEAKHLSPEQKELFGLEIQEALSTKDTEGATNLTVMNTLRRIRFELRQADTIAVSIEKALSKFMSELPKAIQEAMNIHTRSCPMGTFDLEEFYKKIMEGVEKKVTSIIKTDELFKNSRPAKTMKELFFKFANKAVDGYSQLILIGLVVLIMKYGMPNFETIKLWFGL